MHGLSVVVYRSNCCTIRIGLELYMASATSDDDIAAECSSSSDCSQYCTEVSPTASEMVVVTHKMIKWDGDRTMELVTGQEDFIPINICDSKT